MAEPFMSNNPSVGIGDLVTTLKISNQNAALLVQAVTALTTVISGIFPRISGTFTLSAAATTVVPQTAITAASQVWLIPTNAAAATLVGSTKSPYVSARSVGVSFTVATASGVAAAGAETFSYFIISPLV